MFASKDSTTPLSINSKQESGVLVVDDALSSLEWQRNTALYRRIEAFSFDEGETALSFAARLARENVWPIAYAERVIDEYKKFMFLAVVAGHSVTPSDQVDQVWHLHLLYTRSYWDRFCEEVLLTPVHHGPTEGGQEEKAKFADWYRNTLESYEKFFGQAPPPDIWPDASIRFGDDLHFTRINTRRNWVIPHSWSRQFAFNGILVLLPLLMGATDTADSSSGGWFALLWFLFIVFSIFSGNGGGAGSGLGDDTDGDSSDGGDGGGCSGCGGCGGCG